MTLRGISSVVDPVVEVDPSLKNPSSMSSREQKWIEILHLPTLVAHKATRIVDERASCVGPEVTE
jgi:hypothetical protein